MYILVQNLTSKRDGNAILGLRPFIDYGIVSDEQIVKQFDNRFGKHTPGPYIEEVIFLTEGTLP